MAGPAPVSRHPWEIERARAVGQILTRLYSPADLTSVLDVGCGDGYMAFKLRRCYPAARIECVDTNLKPRQIGTLSRHDGAVTFHNTYDSLKKYSCQLILLLDVLEHVGNDQEFLRRIISFARPGGRVLITVPAFQSLFGAHDEFLEHRRRYNRRELLATALQGGLGPIRSGYLFSSLLMPRIVSLWLGKLMRRRSSEARGVGGWRHGPLITRAIALALELDNRLSLGCNYKNIVLPGLSVWTLCDVQQL